MDKDHLCSGISGLGGTFMLSLVVPQIIYVVTGQCVDKSLKHQVSYKYIRHVSIRMKKKCNNVRS